MIESERLDATIDDMEVALHRLLGEIVQLKDNLSPTAADAIRKALYGRSGAPVTPFKSSVDLIAASPIDGALRMSVRQIGEGLFRALQSPEKMLRIAKSVCSRDEVNWSRRMTIIDAAWEGIGSDADGYWS